MRTGSITLGIDSRLDNVFLIGSAVNTICRAIALSDQAAYEAEVSVVEAVNNAIEHAYENEGGHRLEVVVTIEPDRITFQVCDWGHSLHWNGEPPPPPVVDANDVERLSEGGRGLFIMYAFSDHIDYHHIDDKNVLTLVKQLPASGAAKAG